MRFIEKSQVLKSRRESALDGLCRISDAGVECESCLECILMHHVDNVLKQDRILWREAETIPAIHNGEIVDILTDWSPKLPTWFLYFPSKRHNSAAMPAFVGFVADRLVADFLDDRTQRSKLFAALSGAIEWARLAESKSVQHHQAIMWAVLPQPRARNRRRPERPQTCCSCLKSRCMGTERTGTNRASR